MTIELIDISYRNGERCPLLYDYRKKIFESYQELEAYRKYLAARVDIRFADLFFQYRVKEDVSS